MIPADESEPYRSVAAVERGLRDNPDRASEEECRPLLRELSIAYQRMVRARSRQPAIYQPGGEWAVHVRSRDDFYRCLERQDLDGAWLWLRDFWRNPLGVIVKQYATFERLVTEPGARENFAALMARDYVVWKNLFNEPPSTLAVPAVGNPWGYDVDGVVIAPKAMRYHALARQVEELVTDVERPVVAEIGAGYGGVAHYLARAGRDLIYVDFDLPETLILAAYYLRRTLPHCRIRLLAEADELTPAMLTGADVVLAPNWTLPRLAERSVDLFLNTFSLSEMPMPTIEEYLHQIVRTCRGYFLHNNMDRAGVINAGCERVPCSRFPIPRDCFKRLYQRYDLFQDLHTGRDGDYREVLYQKIGP